jgi:hypothetical protein
MAVPVPGSSQDFGNLAAEYFYLGSFRGAIGDRFPAAADLLELEHF